MSQIYDENEDFDNEDYNDIDDDSFDINSDDDSDDVIEIDDEDINALSSMDNESSVDEAVLSKHTIEGKHSLKYDSIFKGRKEDPLSEDDLDGTVMYFNETFEVDKGSAYWTESIDNENYIKNKLVKEKVYDILDQHTNINFLNNRRKPSKDDFNNYFYLLKVHLKDEGFTNTELFNELAVYFSDNLFNMLKLLDNKWKNSIIAELMDHIGKQSYSNEVLNRNIYEGTEIEFIWHDELTDSEMLITGVIEEAYYKESEYKVNSYENIYNIHLSDITKILNNTKFKHNLNKLNNIDFL